MTNRAEFERLLDVYGFRCERFGQDLSTHARAQVVSAFAALASAPVATEDGYCLVPTEPTHAMLQALSGEWHSSKHEQARANYSAMLKAAPVASAPVADERTAFKKCHSAIIKALSSITTAAGPGARKADDPELLYRSPVMDDVVRIRVALDECSAALASGPVAGEAVVDQRENNRHYGRGYYAGMRRLQREVAHIKDEYGRAVLKVVDRLIEAQERTADAAPQASPVAGEAQPVAWVAADTLNSPHPKCISSLAYMSQIDQNRGREYVPLYAAPVAAQKADDARDAAFEAVRQHLCKLQRYSFIVGPRGGVRRVKDRVGNWIEFDAVHELFDPVAVDAAMAAEIGKNMEKV